MWHNKIRTHEPCVPTCQVYLHAGWQLFSVQGVALRYVDYALTGRSHSARQLYSVLYLNIYALRLSGAEGGEDAEHDAYKDAHKHTDESVEEETDVGAEIEPEDNGFAREESDECGHTAHALEEDADEEQTTDTAGEKTEKRVEIVKEREDVPRCHEERKTYAKQTGKHA